MLKWAKFFLALLLLPFCAGGLQALVQAVRNCAGADTVWVPLLAGGAAWISFYLLMPPPLRLYVFGHEFTHVLAAWAFGGKVKKFRATAAGGHVVVTRQNFLIVLAPYFFPFYLMLLAGIFALGDAIWGWDALRPWFYFLAGAAYGFHLTLNVRALQTRQSDIVSQGRLFSAVIILLGNMILFLTMLSLLTQRAGLLEIFSGWWRATAAIYRRLGRLF